MGPQISRLTFDITAVMYQPVIQCWNAPGLSFVPVERGPCEVPAIEPGRARHPIGGLPVVPEIDGGPETSPLLERLHISTAGPGEPLGYDGRERRLWPARDHVYHIVCG